jgi:hypothetical protein
VKIARSRRLLFVFVSILATAIMLGAINPASPKTLSQLYFGARFEPPAGRVLHGWGQFSHAWDLGEDEARDDAAQLGQYEADVAPHKPAMISFYVAPDDRMLAGFESRYREFCANRGFLVAQLGLGFQTMQREVADGSRDRELMRLAEILRAERRPVLMRIGFEFNNPWATYDPALYVKSFRRIAGILRDAHADNVATVWNATASGFAQLGYMRWYPGDAYVDWWSINLFDPSDFRLGETPEFLADAVRHRRPVLIAETSPVFALPGGTQVRAAKSDEEAASWGRDLFAFIRAHPEIKGVSFVMVDWTRWRSFLPGHGWPDTRLSRWPGLRAVFEKALGESRFVDQSEAEKLIKE